MHKCPVLVSAHFRAKRGGPRNERSRHANTTLNASRDGSAGRGAGRGPGDPRQHQRYRSGSFRSHSRSDGHDHQRRHRDYPDAGDQRQRLLRSAAAAGRAVPGYGRHGGFQGPDPERHHAVGRPVVDPEADAGSRGDLRTHRRVGHGASPRYDLGLLGPELRSGVDRRVADGVEHADAAGAVRAGRGQPDDAGAGDLGADRRPDQRRGNRCRRRRRLQLHGRRRHQRRQQPPHRQLAERRHDRGDARRDVQLRRRSGPRHRRHDRDDDARGLELAARHGELPGTGPTRSIR